MSDDSGKAIQVHLWKLDYSLHEAQYARVDQIKYLNNSLHDSAEAHCHTLAKAFRNPNHDYECSMMIEYFSSTFNHESATYSTSLYIVDGIEFIKNNYCIVMTNVCLRHRSVKMIREDDAAI